MWSEGTIPGAMKRPLDSDVESVKICPKTSGVEASRPHCSRGVPLEVSGVGGGGPFPQAISEHLGQGEVHAFASGQAHVRGSFCEVEECESVLVAKMKESGATTHALSGRVNTHVFEPFDELKVAVKRGEIDWLHIVPEFGWCEQDRVITRVVKLCRVASRRGIWWSLENPTGSRLWINGKIK